MGNTDNITNEQIYQLLQRTSQDILEIKKDLATYTKEIEDLKSTVEGLETENQDLKQKLSFHEDLLKRKNILIFGLVELENKPLVEILTDFFKNNLCVNIQSNEFDIFYRIGKRKNGQHRPIMVKFLREFTVKQVLKNAYKLKGTGLSVARDQTPEKRADTKILYEFLKIAKAKAFPAKVSKSTLIIGNDKYTPENLRSLNRDTFLEPFVDKSTLFPNTSAPSSPAINEQIISSCEDEAFDIIAKVPEEKEIDNIESTKETKENSEQEIIEPVAHIKKTRSKTLSTQTPTGRQTRNNSTKQK